MYVLGISAFHGDAAAVLLRDGQLVAAVEEERFRRVKHWAGFPAMAIQQCLEIGGIEGRAVDHVAIGRDPRAHLWRKAAYTLIKRPKASHVVGRLRTHRQFGGLRERVDVALGLTGERSPRLHMVEHHAAHAASAFHVSPFEAAAVCTVDGFGDFVSTSVGVGRGRRLELVDRVHYPHSLGLLYTALTQFLGFHQYGDEFKVMGLAPYGEPAYVDAIRRLVRLRDSGRFELALEYFRHWKEGSELTAEADGHPRLGRVYSDALEDLLGPARDPEGPLEQRHADLAHSLQVTYEQCLFHVLEALWLRTRLPRLCMAGGCAMNSVANGKVSSNTRFEEIYVPPAAADNGTALGAAFWVWHEVLRRPRAFVMSHAFWGTAYADADVITDQRLGLEEGDGYASESFETEAALCAAAAELIAAGKVVGWFQGRMEWGARALGNRSILADPRRPDMRDLINIKIKFRERFRPFAPSVLKEALGDWFDDASPDAFMQQVYPVRRERRAQIPAVTHVDGSGRIQAVSREDNPLFWQLIREFERLTGVPMVLNTSFNESEPIVESPSQALDCFFRTRMDALVIGRTLLRRVPVAESAALIGE